MQVHLTSSNSVQIEFIAQPNTGYVLEYRDSVSSGAWQALVVLDPIASFHTVLLTEMLDPQRPNLPCPGMAQKAVRKSSGWLLIIVEGGSGGK